MSYDYSENILVQESAGNLLRYLHKALKKLNPWMNDDQISEAQKVLESQMVR